MGFSIDERFCGVPGAANGGYLGGRLAALAGDVVEVSFRRITPLGRELRVETVADGIDLYDERSLLVTARRTMLDVDPPEPVPLESARVAALGFPRFHDHPVPRCFVCGTERAAGDGLRILPGRVPARETVWASPWTPDASLADDRGVVLDEHHWAALDCTGAFAVNEPSRGLALLGRLAARILRRARAGEEVAVIGWPIGAEERKLTAGTAIYASDGELCAVAKALWVLT